MPQTLERSLDAVYTDVSIIIPGIPGFPGKFHFPSRLSGNGKIAFSRKH
jgi:hypothetical protein